VICVGVPPARLCTPPSSVMTMSKVGAIDDPRVDFAARRRQSGRAPDWQTAPTRHRTPGHHRLGCAVPGGCSGAQPQGLWNLRLLEGSESDQLLRQAILRRRTPARKPFLFGVSTQRKRCTLDFLILDLRRTFDLRRRKPGQRPVLGVHDVPLHPDWWRQVGPIRLVADPDSYLIDKGHNRVRLISRNVASPQPSTTIVEKAIGSNQVSD
jgi:hypothetical protein